MTIPRKLIADTRDIASTSIIHIFVPSPTNVALKSSSATQDTADVLFTYILLINDKINTLCTSRKLVCKVDTARSHAHENDVEGSFGPHGSLVYSYGWCAVYVHLQVA